MVTLEDLHEEIKNMSTKHNAYTEKLEARLKQLEADNKALREAPPSSTENAAAVALSQTPKTKSVLEQEEAEIHKGMDKMLKNNSWPIPSVATATAAKDMFTNAIKGMRAKSGKPPPTIQAFTGLLELEGDLVSFLSAMAEGTFGNEDVRAMVANGLKSYATAFIAKKIMESEGELMKLVAKNDMPGTATMILGKVRDQIATARTPLTPKSNFTQKSIGQYVKENGKQIDDAASKMRDKAMARIEGKPDTTKTPAAATTHTEAAHATAPKSGAHTEAADAAKALEAQAIADATTQQEASLGATQKAPQTSKVDELNKLKETQTAAEAARKATAASNVIEAKAAAEINHLTLKDEKRLAKEEYASTKKPTWFGTEKEEDALKRREAKTKLDAANAALSKSRFTRRNARIATAITGAPRAAIGATTRSAKAAIRAITPTSLKNQKEAYLKNTAWGREKAERLLDALLSDVDAASATYSAKHVKQSEINRMYRKQSKLQELLTNSKNELSKLDPASDAGDIVAKKAEIKVLTEALSNATEEIMKMRVQAPSP